MTDGVHGAEKMLLQVWANNRDPNPRKAVESVRVARVADVATTLAKWARIDRDVAEMRSEHEIGAELLAALGLQ